MAASVVRLHLRSLTFKTSNMGEYIKPSKGNEIFVADNNYFGYILDGMYKDAEIEFNDGNSSIMPTFALSYAEAVRKLHDWILDPDNQWLLDEPHITFRIHSIDGSIDEMRDEVKMTKVYTLSTTKLRKYFRR